MTTLAHDMTATPSQAPKDRRDRGPALLAGTVGGALLLGLAITAGINGLVGWEGGWRAWGVSAGVGLLAVLATLPLLLLVGTRVRAASADEMARLASMVLMAGMVRMIIAGLGIVVPVKLFGVATWPMFTFVAVHYLLITAAEVSTLGLLFWRKDTESPAAGNGATTPPAR